MKITFVLNNDNWATISSKVSAVSDFFSTLDTDITYVLDHTSFSSIPFVPVSALGGVTNTIGSTTTVDPNWFNQNISSLHKDSDIIIFCLSPQDIQGTRTSIGIEQGKVDGIVQCCIFGISENDRAYINMADQGNSFVLFVCHEISHALYLLQGKKDNTHSYFYTGQPKRVLPELMQGRQAMIKSLLNYCLQLLGLYKQQQTIMNTVRETPPTNKPIDYVSAHPKIYSWAKAIQVAEGWCLPGGYLNGEYYPNGSISYQNNSPGNLGYSSLTSSWGALQGGKKTDGGHFSRFKTYDEGFIALCIFLTLGCENQLIAYHKTRTLGSFTKVYAGDPEDGYIATIIAILRVPIDTDISTFL